VRVTDSRTVHGYVNAKNGFGGYDGYTCFSVFKDALVEIDNTSAC
jgi:hypothetical protein